MKHSILWKICNLDPKAALQGPKGDRGEEETILRKTEESAGHACPFLASSGNNGFFPLDRAGILDDKEYTLVSNESNNHCIKREQACCALEETRSSWFMGWEKWLVVLWMEEGHYGPLNDSKHEWSPGWEQEHIVPWMGGEICSPLGWGEEFVVRWI